MTVKEFLALSPYSQLYKITHPRANHAKILLAWYRHTKAEERLPELITPEYIADLKRKAN